MIVHEKARSTNTTEQQQNVHSLQMKAFGVSLVLFEVLVALLYGFFGKTNTSLINISSIVFTILLALLTTIGFGLYFSYLKRIMWTGLGVTFLLTAFAIQCYPLANSLWTELTIFNNPNPNMTDTTENNFAFFLASFDNTLSTNNNITGCIRCALALVIGCSGILGRATPLDYLIFAIMTTFSFELNRQIVANLGIDHFGSYTIFGFGGFVSLGQGLLFLLMEDTSNRETQLKASQTSLSFSLIGSLVIFTLVPVLAFQGDGSMKRQTFTNYTTALSVLLIMGAAIVTGMAFSMLVHGHLRARDVQNALIAGMVMGGSASYFLPNPGYSILLGALGAIFQKTFEMIVEKPLYRRLGVSCTYPPFMFALQSILCCAISSIFSDSNSNSQRDNLTYSTLIEVKNIFAMCFVSVGIGFGTGLVIGLIIFVLRGDDVWIRLNDQEFWVQDDRIRHIEKKMKYAPGILERMQKEEEREEKRRYHKEEQKRKKEEEEQLRKKRQVIDRSRTFIDLFPQKSPASHRQPYSDQQFKNAESAIRINVQSEEQEESIELVENVEDLELDFVDMLQVAD